MPGEVAHWSLCANSHQPPVYKVNTGQASSVIIGKVPVSAFSTLIGRGMSAIRVLALPLLLVLTQSPGRSAELSTTTTVTASANTTYGAGVTLTATVIDSNLVPVTSGTVTFTDNVLGPLTCTGTGDGTLNPTGKATCTVIQAANYSAFATFQDNGSDLTSTSNTVTPVITPANLVITPNGGLTKPYGQVFNPAGYSAVVTGLQYKDAGTATFASTGAPAAAAVGTYNITSGFTFTSGSALNYNIVAITAMPGLAVTPVPLSVTVNAQTKLYGAALPALTYGISGLAAVDTVGATITVGLSTTATAASPVGGAYPITATVGGSAIANYTLTNTPALLTVSPAPLTVTVNNSASNYGAALPAFTDSVAGLTNGDTVGTTITIGLATTATAGSPTGGGSPAATYPITATVGGTAIGNYTLTNTPGILTVNQAPLTVTVAPQTVAFGATLPALTGNVTGLVNGDTVGGAITVSYSTTATPASTPGTYPITATVGGSAAGDYTVTNTPALLTVTAGTQTISFDAIPNRILGISPFPVNAQASSDLPVTIASTTPAVCTSAADLVILRAAGTCSLTASQGGSVSVGAAPPVTRSFQVNQATASSGALTAAPGSPFAAGANPFSTAVGDFNGDGIPDLVTSNTSDNTVTVMLGNGSGGFTAAPGSPFATGGDPVYVTVGDFNGDGIQDLATANTSDNTVTVLLGNGSGGFTPAPGNPFATGASPGTVVVGDFNGDGIEDLAAANGKDNTVTILLGNGLGGFVAASGSLAATGANPASIAVGDFNRDGIQDLAVADFNDGTLTVLLGNGTGGFTAATGSPIPVGTNPASVVVGSFNGDSFQDLAVANFGDSTVTVLLGNGSGGFTPSTGSPFTVGSGPAAALAGDFNGDGITDLAVSNFSASTVTVLLGNGSGSFAAAAGGPFPTGTNPAYLAVGDFNGDGAMDVATPNDGANNITVLLGMPVGTTPQTITFGPLSGVTVGVAPFTVSATASSGLTPVFTSTTTGVCTVAGATVTVLATGTCSITASQPANATYAAATPVIQSFTVAAVFVPPPPPPPVSLAFASSGNLSEIAIGTGVSAVFSVYGGSPPYTWSASALPAGLTLGAATGVLSGVPAAPGNFSFTVTVTDSASPAAVIKLPVTLPVLGITTPSSLPAAVTKSAYSQTFAATGGAGHYTFTSSNAPAGLAFSGSTLSGIPPATGTFTFQVQVADGSGITASSTFSVIVTPSLSITSSANLGEIASGASFVATLTATGGKQPYIWSAPNLPAGVSLNPSGGALEGSPGQPGVYSFAVQVSDSETPAATASLTVTLHVLGLTTPAALPGASTTSAYSQTFSATGGVAPYTFSSPNPPAGLSFSGATLSGTPSKVGTYNFTVSVSDTTPFSTSSSFSLVVTGPPGPFSIGSGALPGGTAGTTYSQALTGTGGAPPYTWAITGGALPPGLSLTGSSGLIAGTPSTSGTFTFTARATDSSQASLSAVFTITIAPKPLLLSGLPLPNGIAGIPYPLQILSGSAGVPPYTFAIGSGSLPPGLTLASGEISGTPSASGAFSFSITMTDSESPALTVTSAAQTVIAAAGNPNLVLSAGALSFNLAAGASGVPAPGSITVSSSFTQQPLNYSVVTTPAVSWLDVTSGSSTPGSIGVSVDPGAINLGPSTPLTTGIVVTCLAPSPCAGLSQTIPVSLSVTAPPPLLAFTTNLVQFNANTPISQQIGIQNTGGGAAVIGSASAADSWLTVSGVPASLPAGPPVNITFTANPASLAPGFFRTQVTILSSGGTIVVPVTLNVSQAGAIALSAYGAQFQSTVGSPSGNSSGSFQVASTGSAAVNWTASVLPGASWLHLSVGTMTGTSTGSSPGTVNYFVSSGALTAAQTYYGTIQITAAGITDSPQNFLVVLSVAPATAPPALNPSPSGLVFQSAFGASAPASRSVTVFSNSGTGVPYSASASTANGIPWLTVSPLAGTSAGAGSPGVSTVSVNPGTLPAGIYPGVVNYQLSPGNVRSVNVTLIVSPATSGSGCVPSQLAPVQTGLVNNFAQPVAWPVPLSVTVLNNCGLPVSNGQVTAAFSNGDPSLTLGLVSAATGLYSGTWIPAAVSGQVTVTATATAPGIGSAAAGVTGEVIANAAPLLAPGGTVHVYDPLVGGAIAPGTILEIFGSNLSAAPAVPSTAQLPTTLGGTSVTIGGIPAPLYYAGPGQIDAQVPYELTPGDSYQVIVGANGAIGMPGSIQIAAATPGVAAFPNGQVVAQHPNFTLVSETSPAAPGEYLVIYLAGMGLTNNIIADGAPTPDSPLSIPRIAPTLTLNGVSIPIYFSGLTPGYTGLYQMNFQVPLNTPNGDTQLVVSQGGQASNPVILPVQN